jgi:hypothetical protein
LPETSTSRLRLAWSQLIDQLKMPLAPAEVLPRRRLRNFVLDVLAEGRRKSIAHVMIEADIGRIRQRLAERRLRGATPVSLTSVIAKTFADAVAADRRMQAYRFGRARLVVFDDVDITFMIEREWEDEPLPVFYILRAAQQKSVYDIHRELQRAKETPLGTTGPMNALEMRFFLLPGFLRRGLWFVLRRYPYWFKDVAGTVGLTSMGMYTSAAAIGIPITPMTLTLTVGTIEKKLVLADGAPVEREFLHLNFSVDHDVVDGAPLMRFIERFKEMLLEAPALLEAADEPPTKERQLGT